MAIMCGWLHLHNILMFIFFLKIFFRYAFFVRGWLYSISLWVFCGCWNVLVFVARNFGIKINFIGTTKAQFFQYNLYVMANIDKRFSKWSNIFKDRKLYGHSMNYYFYKLELLLCFCFTCEHWPKYIFSLSIVNCHWSTNKINGQ